MDQPKETIIQICGCGEYVFALTSSGRILRQEMLQNQSGQIVEWTWRDATPKSLEARTPDVPMPAPEKWAPNPPELTPRFVIPEELKNKGKRNDKATR